VSQIRFFSFCQVGPAVAFLFIAGSTAQTLRPVDGSVKAAIPSHRDIRVRAPSVDHWRAALIRGTTFAVGVVPAAVDYSIAAAIPCQIERELKEGLFTVLPVEASWLRANYGFITKRGRTPSPH
jgi:hypothetical protein